MPSLYCITMSKKELHAELIKKVKDMEHNRSGKYYFNIRGQEEWFQRRKQHPGRRVWKTTPSGRQEARTISTGWAPYDNKKKCWPDWYCFRLRNIKNDKGKSLEGHNEFHALYKEDLYYWAKLNKLKVRRNMKYRELATIIYRNT